MSAAWSSLSESGTLRRRAVGTAQYLLHAPRRIDAHHLQLVAQIARAHPARAAGPAEDQGLDDDPVALAETDARRRRHDFREDLVADDAAPGDAMIEMPLVNMQVSTADAHTPHPQQRLSGSRNRLGSGTGLKSSGPAIIRRSHSRTPPSLRRFVAAGMGGRPRLPNLSAVECPGSTSP